MPLIVTDYAWTQTESMVYINVPLKGVKVGTVDICSTDEYLKVHFPPFLFEAFLLEPVNDDKSTAKIGNGVAVITLPKRINKMWEHLMITTNDKEKMKEIRERALSKYQEKLAAESKAKAEKKGAEKKYALESMMKIEQEERDSIQKMKDNEQAKATAELEAWKSKQREKANEKASLKPQSQRVNQDKQEAEKKLPVNGCTVGCNNNLVQRGSTEAKSNKKLVDFPALRAAGNIQITFTPRLFPTALRESKVQEEEEWLRKQAEARSAVSADLDELKDLKEEERILDWLKEKGDKCFATGNYMGAVNAYTVAIKLHGKIPALYSNRAACHLKLRNLHKAIKDSSQALELLTPLITDNAPARARAHVRRGSAFCQLQLYIEALQDYEAALKIDPYNEALQADIQRIRTIIQGTTNDHDRQ